MLRWLWVSAVVLLLDQCSKFLADASLALYQSVDVMPSLAIRLAYNSGAAFSFLSDASGWQRWFFIVLSVVVVGILIVWLTRLPSGQAMTALALALILGGAAGNLVDRVLYGYVIDFIDVYYGSWHWPTFNIADSAISAGAFLLLLDAFRGHKDKQAATR
ncbi:MAG: lipoprotein signal peptidase [Gammaproteobacteria bacterium]|nr:lipoprotein signal peptidase [Gammaproteobacteria bacterium]